MLCHPQEKSPWREAALCREAVSSTGQGKKWGISSFVHGTDFSPGGSSPFSSSPGQGEDRNSTELGPIVGKETRGQQSQLSPQASSSYSMIWNELSLGRTIGLHLGPTGTQPWKTPIGSLVGSRGWKFRATLTHGPVGNESSR